jgi:hypothetical protein
VFWIALWAACTPPPASQFLAYTLNEDQGHSLQPREIPSLSDPVRMRGDLGTIWSGGAIIAPSLAAEEVVLSYREGRPLEVLYTVVDGVAKPLDRAGLVLFSFYGHLEDVETWLSEAEIDVSDVFPLDAAVAPVVPDIAMAIQPAENAAYVSTAHTFILLDDLIEKEVPLAANAGIVFHEFAHALFQVRTVGDAHAPGITGDTAQTLGVASLNEGFADSLASLVSGRSNFISDSLDMPSRDVSGDWLARDVDPLPAEVGEDASSLLLYDPYALGTVFAALAWDLAEFNGDAAGTLRLWVRATESWGANWNAAAGTTAFGWLDHLVDEAGDGEVEFLCGSIGIRFADVYEVAACG